MSFGFFHQLLAELSYEVRNTLKGKCIKISVLNIL